MDIFDKIYSFYNNFNGKKQIIGKSVFGMPIFVFTVEKTIFPQIIVQYSMHAREYITSLLALKQIERFACFGKVGTVHFIPLVNPDGVKIATTINPTYKANGRGVDLNVNFDAMWGQGQTNTTIKGDCNYIGEHPFSEPESIALRDFTLKIKPNATVSYHSKGEEIYYEFHQSERDKLRDYSLAKAVRKVTGYKIKSTPNSCGGYKDWCVQKLKIPSLTIEVGCDLLSHPIGEENLDSIYLKNQKVIETVIKWTKNNKKSLCAWQ